MFEDESKCFFIDVIDEMIEEDVLTILSKDLLGTYLSYWGLGIIRLRECYG